MELKYDICPIMLKEEKNLQKHKLMHLTCTNFPPTITQQHEVLHVTSLKLEFNCDHCTVAFETQSELEDHKKIHEDDVPKLSFFERTNDDVSYKKPSSFQSHMRIKDMSDEKKQFPVAECNICKKKFYKNSYLTKHMRVHTKECPYVCEICQEKFPWKQTLERHMLKHTGHHGKEECNICKKKFISKHYLTRHMRVHTKERPHVCEICQEKFTWKDTLDAHMIKHTGDYKFKCEFCAKPFAKRQSFQGHMISIHGKEDKLHECNICKKKFSEIAHLTGHMTVHTEECPYVCEICQTKFKWKQNFNRHMRKHPDEHKISKEDDKSHECNICEKKFSSKWQLTRHIMTVHTKDYPYVCEICEEKFPRKERLDIHMIKHTGEYKFRCELCKKPFAEKRCFQAHLISIHGKEDDDKSHECNICKEKFSTNSNLTYHMRVHT